MVTWYVYSCSNDRYVFLTETGSLDEARSFAYKHVKRLKNKLERYYRISRSPTVEGLFKEKVEVSVFSYTAKGPIVFSRNSMQRPYTHQMYLCNPDGSIGELYYQNRKTI